MFLNKKRSIWIKAGTKEERIREILKIISLNINEKNLICELFLISKIIYTNVKF